MVSEEFAKEIVSALKERLDGVSVSICHAMKNNVTFRTGIAIRETVSNMLFCIYLEEYYFAYKEGEKSIRDIVEDIIYINSQNDFDASIFNDYSAVRTKLRGRLVNTEKNRELLKSVPHREFMDLSIIYYVEAFCLDGNQGIGNIQVHYRHLQSWGVTENDLYNRIVENMSTFDRACILRMSDIMAEISEPCCGKMHENTLSAYVLTNQSMVNGAIQILNRRALEDAACMFGSDFFILPSSVHETILVSANDYGDEVKELAVMVNNVNETSVLENEILSYHVYRYCKKTRQIRQAA